MSKNHGFLDGNKRTTLLLLHTLLDRSGYVLVPLTGERLDEIIDEVILDAVNHKLTFDELTVWFKNRVRRP